MTDEQRARRLAAMNRASQQAIEHLTTCTVPFIAEQEGKFWGVGSGVLFEIGERPFILTASHVFTKLQEVQRAHLPIFMSTAKPGVPFVRLDQVAGYYSINPKDSGHPEDPLDVAMMILSRQAADALRGRMHFLHMPELDLDDGLGREGQYLTFGYPHSLLNQRDEERRVVYSPLHLISRVYAGGRGALPNHHPEVEVVVDFLPDAAKDSEGRPVALPAPHGASGCGIWRIVRADDDYERWHPSMLRLVGIEHTWNRQAHVLRGTRIRYVIAEMARRYEDIRPILELAYARPRW